MDTRVSIGGKGIERAFLCACALHSWQTCSLLGSLLVVGRHIIERFVCRAGWRVCLSLASSNGCWRMQFRSSMMHVQRRSLGNNSRSQTEQSCITYMFCFFRMFRRAPFDLLRSASSEVLVASSREAPDKF